MNPEDQNNSNQDTNTHDTGSEPVKIDITQPSSGTPETTAPEVATAPSMDNSSVAQEPSVTTSDSYSPSTPAESSSDIVTPTSEPPVSEPVTSEAPTSTTDAVSDVSAQPEPFTPPPAQTQSPSTESPQPSPNTVGAEQQSTPQQDAQISAPAGNPPKKTLGVLSIVFAFLLPPIGFILSIISMIKGYKKDNGNKALGNLGAIGLICAIFVVPVIYVMTITTFVGIQEKAKWSSYVTKTGEISGTKYKIDVPAGYTAEFKQDSESNGYGIKADEDTYLSQTVVSISAYPEAKQIQGAFSAYESAPQADKEKFEKSFGEGFKPSFESEIGCKDTTFNNFSSAKLSGTTKALQFNFNCTSKKYEKYQVQGQLILGVDDSKLVGLFLASESGVYKKHPEAWSKIINSFQVTQ